MGFTVKCTHWDTSIITKGIKKCKLCGIIILTDYQLSDVKMEWDSK